MNRTNWEDCQGRIWMIQDHPTDGITVRLTGRGFEDERTSIAVVPASGNAIHIRAIEA